MVRVWRLLFLEFTVYIIRFPSDDLLELAYIFEGHSLGVVSVDINNSGTVAASNSLDSHIRLWDLSSGEQVKSIDGGPVNAWTVCFSPDSEFIATCTQSGKIILYPTLAKDDKVRELDSTGKFTMSVCVVSCCCFCDINRFKVFFISTEFRWQTNSRWFHRRHDQAVRCGNGQAGQHSRRSCHAHPVVGVLERWQVLGDWLGRLSHQAMGRGLLWNHRYSLGSRLLGAQCSLLPRQQAFLFQVC